MYRYVIERDIPGAGELSNDQLQGIARSSNAVLHDLGPDIQWIESYVTADRLYCVYLATSEDIIYEHARRGGFPANRVSEVARVIDPTTAGVFSRLC
jgi:hypothetical protein